MSDPFAGLGLRDWQAHALSAWAAADCRGVIEAVTGSGKTRVAVAAVRACLTRGGRSLVLVPTLDLQHQWVEALGEHAPEARVGRLGGGCDADLHDHSVVVATPHSAAPLPLEPPRGDPGLLVADEAHRYGAPTWAGALKSAFTMRLALTATYERNDDGLAEVLGPYFGGVVASYSFEEAAADGVIAPFAVGFAAVALTAGEQARYDAADQQLRRFRGQLVRAGLPREPLAMIRRASELVAGAGQGQASDRAAPAPRLAAARGFLSALRTRRDVAARAAGKQELLRDLAPALAGRRVLVFTDTVAQAERAARGLSEAGREAAALHGRLADRQRQARMDRFRSAALDCLVAPRVLDEGVDVPDADVAVVLAAFRTRRQMIQRLGRVLRVKSDGREARLLVVYAEGTREDPGDGAHEGFLDEVTGAAEEVVDLDGIDGPGAVRTWLSRAR